MTKPISSSLSSTQAPITPTKVVKTLFFLSLIAAAAGVGAFSLHQAFGFPWEVAASFSIPSTSAISLTALALLSPPQPPAAPKKQEDDPLQEGKEHLLQCYLSSPPKLPPAQKPKENSDCGDSAADSAKRAVLQSLCQTLTSRAFLSSAERRAFIGEIEKFKATLEPSSPSPSLDPSHYHEDGTPKLLSELFPSPPRTAQPDDHYYTY